MERLNLEQLARLVDEPPTPEEQAILDGDPRLRHELEALRSQTVALKDLPAVLPPPGGWHELEGKLRSAGLIDARRGAPVVWRKWLQMAAALAIFTGGTAFGWATGSAPRSAPGPEDRSANGAADSGAASFSSLDDAKLAVQAAEERLMRTYDEYRRMFDAGNRRQAPSDPAARLAGIEALLAASQAAVAESPGDQFFNGFLLSTLAERQQTLRQIGLDNWH